MIKKLSIVFAAGIFSFAATVFQPSFATARPIVIGAVLEPNINAALLVAQERKLFEQRGVSVSVKLFPTGAEIVQGLAGGSLSVGASGGVPPTVLASRGVKVKAIARLADISAGLALVASPESGIKRPEDIKGKTVGQADGTVSQYLVHAFAKHWDIPLDSFKRVNLGGADQVNALANGSIQVASLWEPFTSRYRDSGGVVLQTALQSYWEGAEGPVNLVGDPGVLFARTDFLDGNPEDVGKLLLAIHDAAQWLLANPDQAAGIVAAKLNVPSSSLAALFRQGHLAFNFDAKLAQDLTAEAEFLQSQNLIGQEFKPSEWLGPEYLHAVLPQLVTYSK